MELCFFLDDEAASLTKKGRSICFHQQLHPSTSGISLILTCSYSGSGLHSASR